MSRLLYIFSTISIAAVAVLLLWFATRWGNGTSPDSIQYLLTARKLSGMEDLLDTPSHFPPLYPLFLSLGLYFTGDEILAVRILHSLIYAANILLFAFLLRDQVRKTDYLGLLGTLLIALAPISFILHFMALSEALFFSFLLLFFIGFDAYLQKAQNRWLYTAALALGLATLTRYSGIAFIGAASLYLLLTEGPRLADRVKKGILFGVTGIALPSFWLLAKILSNNSGTPREFSVHPIDTERILRTLSVPFAWLNPQTLTFYGAIILAIGIVAVMTMAALHGGRTLEKRRVHFYLVGIFTYIVFLYTSISFFDFYTPIDNRILSPVFIMLIAGLVFSLRAQTFKHPTLQVLLAMLLVLPLIGGIPRLALTLKSAIANGSGYFSRPFRSQELLAYLQSASLPKIYTNTSETLAVYFDIKATSLPKSYFPKINKISDTYADSMKFITREITNGNAVLVYFDSFAWRKYYPDRNFLQNELKLPILFQTRGGIIYGKLKPDRDLQQYTAPSVENNLYNKLRL